MGKFEHLKKLELTRETRRPYTFPFISGKPTLLCAPALRANRDYYRAELAIGFAPGARGVKAPTNADEKIKADEGEREKFTALHAAHCVSGWSGVLDKHGVDVPFSPDDCLDWLRSIPDDMWTSFALWLMNAGNFRDALPDVEGVAKN